MLSDHLGENGFPTQRMTYLLFIPYNLWILGTIMIIFIVFSVIHSYITFFIMAVVFSLVSITFYIYFRQYSISISRDTLIINRIEGSKKKIIVKCRDIKFLGGILKKDTMIDKIKNIAIFDILNRKEKSLSNPLLSKSEKVYIYSTKKSLISYKNLLLIQLSRPVKINDIEFTNIVIEIYNMSKLFADLGKPSISEKQTEIVNTQIYYNLTYAFVSLIIIVLILYILFPISILNITFPLLSIIILSISLFMLGLMIAITPIKIIFIVDRIYLKYVIKYDMVFFIDISEIEKEGKEYYHWRITDKFSNSLNFNFLNKDIRYELGTRFP